MDRVDCEVIDAEGVPVAIRSPNCNHHHADPSSQGPLLQNTLSDAARFWHGRKVLLTGHTGFKGAWMYLWLQGMGADVTGYALAPASEHALWNLVEARSRSVIGDIRNAAGVLDVVTTTNPQIVIHMAAQALVRESYRDPLGTYETNVMGTACLLQACRSAADLQCIVVVTSDKVYENHDAGRPFVETDRLGGHDPYSNSKACSELLVDSFRDSFFKDGPPIATVRAGNVIGGGDWSADRLIPDCVRALQTGSSVTLRYPTAVRPWQHVLEPLSGYLALAQALAVTPDTAPRAVNFGPGPASFCTVRQVVEAFSSRFAGNLRWQPDAEGQRAEAQALTLSSTLAQQTLGWQPRLGLEDSLSWTADWYRSFSEGADMLALSHAQLGEYQKR